MWIDLHAHLNMLDVPVPQALEEAKKQNVQRVVTIGTNPEDHLVVLDLAKKYYPMVWCTLGVHPHDADKYNDEVEAFIRKTSQEPRVVAIGEIGLDYYYNHSPKDVQKEVFQRQLEIACDNQLPIQVHTRDAEDDTIQLLRSTSKPLTGVIHCFTGSKRLAEEALAVGLNISISGVVTFKNADDLRNTVSAVPLDRLHVETDSPFLAPVPMRGKKNQPAFVVHTAQKVAELKKVDIDELAKITKENAQRVFKKISW